MQLKPWRTRIPQAGQDKCLRDAFRCENPALISLVLEEGKVSAHEAEKHIAKSIDNYWGGSVEILKMLLDTGAEPSAYHLELAARKGNAEMVDILIQNGAKLSSKSIIEASKNGHAKALKRLLEAGGNPCTRASCPINIAASNGFADVVQLLLDYGEKPTNVRPNVVEKVKRLASKRGYSEYSKTFRTLKEAGLSVA